MQKFPAFVLSHNYTWILHINLQMKRFTKSCKKEITEKENKGIAEDLMHVRVNIVEY